VVVRQQQTDENEAAGEPADDELHFHDGIRLVEV
jgi:hypothetical protein